MSSLAPDESLEIIEAADASKQKGPGFKDLRAPNDAMSVFRWTMLGMYIGWYCKISFFLPEISIHDMFPVSHPSFLGWRASSTTFFLAFMAPIFVAPLLLIMTRVKLLIVAATCVVSAWVLLIHMATFNDATFTTSFWVGIWLFWLAWNSHRKDWALVDQARRLAMMVVSLMFLGGFVGKLTPEYWSGEMFYNYFFLDRNILFYPWLRANLDMGTLRDVATWFSRGVVLMEAAMMLLWLGPFRWVGPLMVVVMASITLGSTPWLLSVFGCLVGMILSNYAWIKEDKV